MSDKEMSNKEILEMVLKEGRELLGTMTSPDDHNYKVWNEKLKSAVRKVFKETSVEYKEITQVSGAARAMTAMASDEELLAMKKKRIDDKLAKLEACISLM